MTQSQILKTIPAIHLFECSLVIHDDPPRHTNFDFSPRVERVDRLPVFLGSHDDGLGIRPTIDGDSFFRDESEGTDVLAWYERYSSVGPNHWGIYFDVEKMNGYVTSVFWTVKQINPSVTIEEVAAVAWQEVHRHELEHCVQELALAAEGYSSGRTIDAKTISDPNKLREALATYWQHTDARFPMRFRAQDLKNLIRHVTAVRRKPFGYDQWNQIDVLAAQSKSYGDANGSLDAASISLLRKRVLSPRASNFIHVPIFYVYR